MLVEHKVSRKFFKSSCCSCPNLVVIPCSFEDDKAKVRCSTKCKHDNRLE